ncbi:MAG TPA: hypothetical protein VD995_04630 [Azospirillum sp.]|nr:hypothetical protein [Azospirillum sp.]
MGAVWEETTDAVPGTDWDGGETAWDAETDGNVGHTLWDPTPVTTTWTEVE